MVIQFRQELLCLRIVSNLGELERDRVGTVSSACKLSSSIGNGLDDRISIFARWGPVSNLPRIQLVQSIVSKGLSYCDDQDWLLESVGSSRTKYKRLQDLLSERCSERSLMIASLACSGVIQAQDCHLPNRKIGFA